MPHATNDEIRKTDDTKDISMHGKSSVETRDKNVHDTGSIIRIGILEVQGAFLEHKNALHKAGQRMKLNQSIEISDIRHSSHVKPELDGIIIPGGESTTISLFLKRNNIEEPLRKWIKDESHVTWGTCAGMILLSKQMENQKEGGQPSIGVMDTDVSRNFFGRQIHSFEAEVDISERFREKCAGGDSFHGVFIRAPAVVKTFSPQVQTLASLKRQDSHDTVIVGVQQGNVIATAFHPELTEDVRWHQFFLQLILDTKSKQS